MNAYSKSLYLIILLFSCFTFVAASNNINLNGIKGKVFHVDPTKKSFLFLKETAIDPKTNEGRSKHTLYWTEKTSFIEIQKQKFFTGLKGPILAEFVNLKKEHLDSIKNESTFMAWHIKIHHDTKKKHGFSDDKKSLVAMFTPSADNKKLGSINLNGKKITVTVRGPRAIIENHRIVSANTIYSGFWETQVFGEHINNQFTIQSMNITSLADPRKTDNPKLPRVLIVGDSISMNYHNATKKELENIANYHRVEGNAGPSDRGVLCMDLWLGDYKTKGLHWDLIQFNHGLHDLKQYYDNDSQSYGKYVIDIKSFKANLEKEIKLMQKTGAKLMWCTISPVPASSIGVWGGVTMGRKNGADLIFNRAALEVLKNYPEILINDINTGIRKADFFKEWSKGKDVHYWHGPHQDIVGKIVAKGIKKALGVE